MAERARIISRTDFAKMRAAEKTITDATAEAAEIVAQAHQKARADRDEIIGKAEDIAIKKAKEILTSAEDTAQKQLSGLEAEISALVAETVAKVIGGMDKTEAVKAATKTALAELSEQTSCKLRTAPEVFRAVSDAVAESAGEGRVSVKQIRADESLIGDRVILSSDRSHTEIGLSDQLTATTESWRDEP